jgi:hypothetical protein
MHAQAWHDCCCPPSPRGPSTSGVFLASSRPATAGMIHLLALLLLLARPVAAPHATGTVKVRRLEELSSRLPGAPPTPIITELNNSYIDETVQLDPATTALVMIDVWNVTEKMLVDNMHKRLLPLLTSARQLGFFIVHAPSEAPLWGKVQVLPGEVLVTGEHGDSARCDLVLQNSSRPTHKNIKHGECRFCPVHPSVLVHQFQQNA